MPNKTAHLAAIWPTVMLVIIVLRHNLTLSRHRQRCAYLLAIRIELFWYFSLFVFNIKIVEFFNSSFVFFCICCICFDFYISYYFVFYMVHRSSKQMKKKKQNKTNTKQPKHQHIQAKNKNIKVFEVQEGRQTGQASRRL